MLLPEEKLWHIDFYQIEICQDIGILDKEDRIIVHWKPVKRFRMRWLGWLKRKEEPRVFRFRRLYRTIEGTGYFVQSPHFERLIEQLNDHFKDRNS